MIRPGELRSGRKAIDLAGDRIGKLLIVERVPKPGAVVNSTSAWWRVSCNCGREEVFSSARLRTGTVLHCSGAWHRAPRR